MFNKKEDNENNDKQSFIKPKVELIIFKDKCLTDEGKVLVALGIADKFIPEGKVNEIISYLEQKINPLYVRNILLMLKLRDYILINYGEYDKEYTISAKGLKLLRESGIGELDDMRDEISKILNF